MTVNFPPKTYRNPEWLIDDFLAFTSGWRLGISEEDIDSAVREDDDELVRVLTFIIGLEPFDNLDFLVVLDLFLLVVFDHCAFVNQLGIEAEHHTRVCSHEQFNLGLIFTTYLVTADTRVGCFRVSA